MTRERARELHFDLFHLPTAEAAEEFAAKLARVTGRETTHFTEDVCGFPVHYAGVTPRPRPVIKVRL